MSELRYTWDGQLMHLKLKGLTNHELRCIILGLWARLDRSDRVDHLSEMLHYLERPFEEMPPLSQAVALGDQEP
jgi:hypothetical protein